MSYTKPALEPRDLAPDPGFEKREQEGLLLDVLEGGEGPPVVFLHGAAGVQGWTPFFRQIAAQHRLVVPSHPGFGGSADLPPQATPATLARFYRDGLARLGLGRFHLIGASLGGWIAAELAALDDSALASLTLIGPVGLLPRIPAPIPEGQTEAEYAVRRLFHDQAWADRLLQARPGPEQQAVLARNQATTRQLGGGTFCNPALSQALAQVSTRTLLLWGQGDAVAPVSDLAVWRNAMPHSQVAILPACGHLPHVEQSDAAAAQILDFHRAGQA